MWDNVSTQHIAEFDYALPERRYLTAHNTGRRGAGLNPVEFKDYYTIMGVVSGRDSG